MRKFWMVISGVGTALLAAAAVPALAQMQEQAPGVIVHEDEGLAMPEMVNAEWRQGEAASTQPMTGASTQPERTPLKRLIEPAAQEMPKVRPGNVSVPFEPATQPVATQPSTRPATQPATQPSTQPATQPSTQPATQPTTRPFTQPSTKPSTQPATKPATAQSKALLSMAPARPNWDHYRVIYQRNMFMAQRSGGSIFGTEGQIPRNTDRTPPPAPAPVRALWVLTGVAVLDDDTMAFAENASTGVTVRARPGDKLGDWKVVSVTAEGIEVQGDGRTQKVAVGASLDGRLVEGVLSPGGGSSSGGSASSGGATSDGGSGAASSPGTSDEAAIRERLKRRRQEQGGN